MSDLTEKTRASMPLSAWVSLIVGVLAAASVWWAVRADASFAAAEVKGHDKELREHERRIQRLEDDIPWIRKTLEKMDKKLDRRGGR